MNTLSERRQCMNLQILYIFKKNVDQRTQDLSFSTTATQPTFTYSKLTTEANMFKVNFKDARTTPPVLLLLTLNIFYTLFQCFYYYFENELQAGNSIQRPLRIPMSSYRADMFPYMDKNSHILEYFLLSIGKYLGHCQTSIIRFFCESSCFYCTKNEVFH